jgi:hypothetical protein
MSNKPDPDDVVRSIETPPEIDDDLDQLLHEVQGLKCNLDVLRSQVDHLERTAKQRYMVNFDEFTKDNTNAIKNYGEIKQLEVR